MHAGTGLRPHESAVYFQYEKDSQLQAQLDFISQTGLVHLHT